MSKAPAKGGAHGHGYGAAPHDDHHGGGDGHDGHSGGHCPPPWILTFADMAVLLMAFFVIMLMSSNTDVPKFNAFAAVMRETFGRVPLDPNDADKGGTSILDLNFGPQSGEVTNDPPATTPQSGDPEVPNSGKAEGVDNPGGGASGGGASDGTAASSQDGDAASAQDGVDQAAKALAKAMSDAIAAGELTVESEEGKVIVRLPKGTGKAEAEKIAAAIGAAADAAAKAKAAEAQATAGDTAQQQAEAQAQAGQTAGTQTIAAEQAAAQAEAASQTAASGQATEGTATVGAAGGGATGTGIVRAKMAALKMGMILEEQMADGEVSVEQRDGAVVVTVGSGGAFISGSADMTAEAQGILEKLQQVSQKAKRIVVTGHTDNVPLAGGQYIDNWDLGAARAASVVREITDSGMLPDAELVATSKGETEPIASNDTEDGRAKNRRIEIEIEFDEGETP
jgi:chemotaxis protein MotB